jgi:cell division inhibitor SepF
MKSSSLRRFKIDGLNYTFNIQAFNDLFLDRAKESFYTISRYEELIAGVLSVDRSTIHNWRMELNGPSDIEKIRALADYWNVDLYALLTEDTGMLGKLLQVFSGDPSDAVEMPDAAEEEVVPVITLRVPQITEKQANILPGICYIAPAVRDDFKPVARSLRERRPVIVNFSDTESKAAARAYNCMLGAAYALGGSVNRITSDVLLFVPEDIEVSKLAVENKSKDLFRTLV